MAYDLAAQKYEDLSIELVDANDGVTVTPEGLRVHGKLFAFLRDDDLVVHLSPSRAKDLVDRGIARGRLGSDQRTRPLVRARPRGTRVRGRASGRWGVLVPGSAASRNLTG